MNTEADTYLPIHEIASKLDEELCRTLPLLHSLSGRDTTSYPYFTGKKVWLRKSKTVPLDDLANFAEDGDFNLSDDIVNQARQLVITRLLS